MDINKKELSSLELYYLVRELRVLEGSKLDRIYHSKEQKNELVLAFHLAGTGKKFLKAVLPGLIIIQDSKDDYETPTGLCMMLRKYLEGSILKSISQIGFERVLELRFESRIDGKKAFFMLLIELFSKGNIIFCNNDYSIMNILEEQHWKDRELKKNNVYGAPKSKHDILDINEEQFSEALKNSGKDSLVKALAIELSLGGLYAEELCLMSGIEKNIKPNLTDKQSSIMYKNFRKLFTMDNYANAVDNKIVPFKLEMYKNNNVRHYESFNQAITANMIAKSDKEKILREKSIEKLKIIIADQENSLIEVEQYYKENQGKAESIYAHYQEINEILSIMRNAREKYSWKQIKEKLSNDPKFKKLIKDIDEKNNEITITLE